MCFKFIPFAVLLVVILVGSGSPVCADQRVWPTGTPTWIPKKSVETPVPEPQSPIESEAQTLGEDLAVIDKGVWQIVKEQWADEQQCLDAVDAHLDTAVTTVSKDLRGSEAMQCEADKASGHQKLALSSDEARRAFVEAYHPAVVELRSVRELVADNPAGEALVEQVRLRQKVWQNTVCEKIGERKTIKGSEIQRNTRSATSGTDS